jgi:riboflavin synthase
MFTGIITAVGRVRSVDPIAAGHDMRLVLEQAWANPPAIGASIACSGCCLTAVAVGPDWFAVDASAETLSKTVLGHWQPGSRVNLERALRVGDELGGHIVAGHVDGVGEIISRVPENGSTRFTIRVPDALARYIAPKGSVAVNGISLTVNEVAGDTFGVNIIPHTLENTDLGDLHPGAPLNIEIDTLARYVARLAEYGVGATPSMTQP